MLYIPNRRKFGIAFGAYWFAEEPKLSRAFFPVLYLACTDVGDRVGYVRRASFTKIVDTNRPDEELISTFNKTSGNEIRRAQRDGVQSSVSTDLDAFEKFYNVFAQQKNLDPVSATQLRRFGPNIQVMIAEFDNTPLVMNSYLVDLSGGRARLLRSASSFRNHSSSDARNTIGRANRFAHWEAMRHFRTLGVFRYDLGGYDPYSTDEEYKRVNQFKDNFGGILVREVDYTSWPLAAYERLRRPV